MTTNGNGKRPLPDGWKWTTIGEVTNPERIRVSPQDHPDLPYIGMDDVESETMRLLGTKSSSEMKSTSEYFKPDDVLYGRLRPYLNKVYRPDFEGLCSAEFIIFRKSPQLSSRYLQYFLNQWSFVSFINMQNTGDRPRVKFSQMADYPFPLAPLPVQERIVAEIEKQFTRLDTAVSTLNRLQSTLDRYQASLLKAACTGQLLPQDANDEPAGRLLQRILAQRRQRWLAAEWQNQIERAQKKVAQAQRQAAGRPHTLRDLDPAAWQAIPEAEYAPYLPQNDKWQKKYKEPAAVETADLPDLPPGWVWTTIEQLAEVLGGVTKNSKRKRLPLEMPYLRVANVYANQLQLDDVETIGVSEGELNRVLLEKNDLLIVEGNGSIDQIGRVALWDGSIDPCVHQNHIIKARLIMPASAKFILYWLLSPGGRKAITEVASSTSGLYTLSLSKVNALHAPLPPLAEQKRIVEEVERRLSVVTATQQAISANQTRSGRLRQSILQQAFNGRLV